MRIRIIEESHSLVAWEEHTPLLSIWAGLLIAFILSLAIVAPSTHPWRWGVIIGSMLFCLGLSVFLGGAAPFQASARVERTSEGGLVRREERWALKGEQVTWESPLEAMASFWIEVRGFEETGHRVVTLSRLWARPVEGAESILLTGWASVASVQALATSVSQAARLPLENEAAGDMV